MFDDEMTMEGDESLGGEDERLARASQVVMVMPDDEDDDDDYGFT